jgi:BASS family bile acid:Na+ symporter
LGLELIQGISGLPLHISPGKVAIVVATTILIPLVAGIVVARLVPRLAAKIEPIISKVGGVLLLVAAVAMIASQWTTIGTLIGDGTLLAFVIFIVVGLVAGHILGGPKPNDRTVLAMATSSRHPGVALAIASLNFPGEKAVLAAALLFLITDAIVSIPYVNWRKRTGATDGSNVVAWPTRGE